MLIRPSTMADIEAVDALLQASYRRLLKPDYPASVLVTVIPLIARAQPNLMTCGTYYVVTIADQIVGAGGWTQAIPGTGGTEPGRGNIRHVVSDYRRSRQGIGQALMALSFDTAKAAGMTWMHCMSTRTAVPFYEALGFEQIGPMSVPIGPAGIGFAAVEMRREL